MHEVVVTASIDAPRTAVEAVISPASIVEYAGTYEVEDIEEGDDAVAVTAVTEELETVLEFTETEAAYVYWQREDRGPFDEMYTSVSLSGDDPVDVTVRSCFTFGLPLSPLTDRLAAPERRTELRRLVAGIRAAAIGDR